MIGLERLAPAGRKSVWDGLFDGFSRRAKLSGRDDKETLQLNARAHENAAKKPVTVESVLSLSTTWACVRLLSETSGTLPCGFFMRTGDDRAAAKNHPLYALLHDSPNADQTAAEFWEAVVACLCLWGNFYAEKEYIGTRLVALTFLRPDCMQVRREDGRRVYRYSDASGAKVLDETKVFHVRGFGVGGDVGLSPISYARQTMGIALAAEETAGATFANGLQLSGFLKLLQVSTHEQRLEMVDLFAKFAGSSQTGKVMPLPMGAEFVPLGISPEDAQLLESRGFNVEEVCRWFRVPPFMVGHTSNSTSWGTGLEQQRLNFLTFALQPYLTRIEQAISKQLLTPGERDLYFAEFNLDGLLRADSAARAAFYASAAQNGWMHRSEIRRKENLPPVEGSDELTVQSNLVLLSKLGEIGAGVASDQQARSAMQNWLIGGDLESIIAAHVKNMIGHNGGPPMEDKP